MKTRLLETLRIAKPRHRADADLIEQEKDARLEQAEQDLAALQERADRALTTLYGRAARNHWRESIELMIQGAP